jgi:putative tryptophan/tyrosine transport system substrate-binding protein
MMHRRRLVSGLTAVAAASLASGQTPARVHRIGYLGYTAINSKDDERYLAAFSQRLRELGLVVGDNLVVEWRFAEGRNDRYAEFAAEMVRLGAELVVAASGVAARAVMAASRSMPIVTVAVPDPVRAGLVVSLARPGGQLTGISNLADELVPKRLELLKAAVPKASRIALARCPRCALGAGFSAAELAALLDEQTAAARSLGATLLPIDVDAAAEFEAARAALLRQRPDALLIGANQINATLQREWRELGVAQRLPMLAPYRGFGAMLSYGPEYGAIFRRVAEYVVRILNGAKPADLPMEQPLKFEFVVNLEAARAIGFNIPQAVLLRADEVIR